MLVKINGLLYTRKHKRIFFNLIVYEKIINQISIIYIILYKEKQEILLFNLKIMLSLFLNKMKCYSDRILIVSIS